MSVGGPVTAEAVLQAAVEGLRLAVVLVCFGAANSLASPYRLLRCLPPVLYEAGVAVTVTLAFAPELVVAVGEVRAARRLRGRPVRGVAGLRGMAVPVLETALDRSLQLAASMDARGYGRRASLAPGTRRVASGGSAVGLLLVVAGVYGLLVPGSLPAGGVPFVALGAALVATGLAARGRRTLRTRYRPDPWGAPEWLVAGSGVAALGALVVASVAGTPGLAFVAYPLTAPALPLLPTVGLVAGLLPALVAPVERGPGRSVPTARAPDEPVAARSDGRAA